MATDPAEDALAQLRARYVDLLARLEDNQASFRRLARSVLRVQEDERRRIARDLHDGVGQNLAALKHQLALLRNTLSGADRERVDACIDLCSQTLEDTRQLSRLLRPQVLDDLDTPIRASGAVMSTFTIGSSTMGRALARAFSTKVQ